MVIYKNKDIETNIKATHVSLGNIGAQFYTEDENNASIRIYIKHNDEPVNLATAGLTPILSLSMQDGSYFENEPVDVVMAEQGLIQYKIRDNVIKHVGKVKATLILKSDTQSIHAADFSFSILSSGLDEQVPKEISVDLIGDKIKEILIANKNMFKGDKGDKGDKGKSLYEIAVEQGFDGDEADFIDSLKPKIEENVLKDLFLSNLPDIEFDSDDELIFPTNNNSLYEGSYFFFGNANLNNVDKKVSDISSYHQGLINESWNNRPDVWSREKLKSFKKSSGASFAVMYIFNNRPILDKSYMTEDLKTTHLEYMQSKFPR